MQRSLYKLNSCLATTELVIWRFCTAAAAAIPPPPPPTTTTTTTRTTTTEM